MDIRTLPAPERDIYNRLKERYSLHFESREVKGHQLRLLKPSNLDELLDGQDPLTKVDSFPFWFGFVALMSGSASLLNAALVVRVGMRRIVQRWRLN